MKLNQHTNADTIIGGDIIEEINDFKCLGSFTMTDGNIDWTIILQLNKSAPDCIRCAITLTCVYNKYILPNQMNDP